MSFELNRDYIAATLCINRDIPESSCGGQCFLMKKLKQTQQDQGTETPAPKRENIWQYCADLVKKPVLIPLRETLVAAAPYQAPAVFYPAAVFHPPEPHGTFV